MTKRRLMKILIVDDHPVTVAGCVALFSADGRHEIHDAGDAETGFALFIQHKPDICILDISLPGESGLDLTKKILEFDNKARIIIFSMKTESAFVLRSMRLGAKGYVTKNDKPDTLLTAAKAVYSGKRFFSMQEPAALISDSVFNNNDVWSILSDRERKIFKLLGQGLEPREVAVQIGVSYKTIVNTCSIIKNKLELRSSIELSHKAREYRAMI